MRNLKLFNHWLAELRDIARAKKVYNEGDDKPMTEQQLKTVFNPVNFRYDFDAGLTPQQTFDKEMELWADAE